MTKIQFNFRWPIKQEGEREIIVEIPNNALGTAMPIIDPDFSRAQKLSGAEEARAELAVLRAVAIIE